MTGFEPEFSGDESNCSANCAATSASNIKNFRIRDEQHAAKAYEMLCHFMNTILGQDLLCLSF